MRREDFAVLFFLMLISLCCWAYWEGTFWVLGHIDVKVGWK